MLRFISFFKSSFISFFKMLEGNNFFSFRLSDVGLVGKITWFILIPLAFCWFIYDPFARYDIAPNTNEPQIIARADINQDLTRTALAEFLQTSLNLGWYHICVFNDDAFKVNGHSVAGRLDRGEVSVQVKPLAAGAQFDNISAFPFQEKCQRISGNSEGVYVGSSTISIGAAINDLPQDRVWVSENEFTTSFTYDLTKIKIYIKTDPLAWFLKLIILIIVWSGISGVIIALIRFLGSNYSATKSTLSH